jgi:tRNA-2-methylthio-N6-dimethylallyladenosine synthase
MKYFLKTFGCQANKSDSERLDAVYQAKGYKKTDKWRLADVIIINSCSVRQRAEDRVVGFIKNINDFFEDKKTYPQTKRPKIILTGCMTYHGANEIKRSIPRVDEIIPIDNSFSVSPFRSSNTPTLIPISSGCNAFCSYCVVPLARGREKSRLSSEILTEIKNLSKKEQSEITLLGQNVNTYGHDLDKKTSFAKLLVSICQIDAVKKINFLTSNPWSFPEELIEIIAKNKKISRFIHLPFQSGSNRILKLMNRHYTKNEYLTLIKKIKTKIPDVIFGTDIIVGFPTETDDDFQETLDLAKKVGFNLAFIAQYSPRPGTLANQKFIDDVPPKIKKQRMKILDELINLPNLRSRPCLK